MKRRLRTAIRTVLLGTALVTMIPGGTTGAAVGSRQDGHRQHMSDGCVGSSSARVAEWARDVPEPAVIGPAEAARLDQQLRPAVAAAGRDRARGRLRPGRVAINTWVHVISTDGTPAGGNVSDEQIAAQMRVLDDSFNGRTGGAPTVFRFVLAGVTRTVNEQWSTMAPETDVELEAKTALRRGGPETLNIYVGQIPDLLGWAYLPDGEVENTPWDGVVVLAGSLPGGDVVPYDLGDTATHEVGHWLALLHTFDNGCERPGDYVPDTPYEAEPAFGYPIGRNTCRQFGADPVENFMDYSDDSCMHAFTGFQSLRMWGAWRTFRA